MSGDVNYASRSLGLHFDGANGSTTFTDNSPRPKTATVFGNAQISTAQSVFGGASGLIDGNGDYLTFADHADFRFGAGAFTIRKKVRLAGYATVESGSYAVMLCAKDSSGTNSREFGFSIGGTSTSFTSLEFIGFSTNSVYTTVVAAYAFALNTWYDVEVCRSGNLIYLFVDGVLLNAGGTAFSQTLQTTATTLRVGALNWDATYKRYLNGNLDDLLIYKGVALHTANFTPLATAFSDVAAGVGGVIRDASGALCSRTVRLVRRDTGALVASGTSDAGTGAYFLATPTLDEVVRIVHSSTTTAPLENDLIDRVIPD